jgi:hypothetical protein
MRKAPMYPYARVCNFGYDHQTGVTQKKVKQFYGARMPYIYWHPLEVGSDQIVNFG